jgi:hypothetical protein
MQGSFRTHPPANDAARALVRQTIRLLFGSTALARYRVEDILRVAGEEPLRLLIKYMDGEVLPALPPVSRPSPPDPPRPAKEPSRPPATVNPTTAEAPATAVSPMGDSPLYVANAGLILLHPLLPHFLQRLGLTTPQHQFVDTAARHRAAHLLQYLVTGRPDNPAGRPQGPADPPEAAVGRPEGPADRPDNPEHRLTHPEHQLVLNKLLCEIPIREPIPLEIIMTAEERQVAAELMEVLRQRWPKMQNTSVEGLQQSFLQRDGSLTATPDGWRLRVQQKGIDVLLSFLPWSWTLVRLPWMNTTIYTEWI